ncbi:hypothetical protein GGR57DRAFT_270790 [Xylariaceae sp. FL1272]|nr:hypothetical protein GGR57DRAFT_270790 [Xylariaceae sp. FL1272]
MPREGTRSATGNSRPRVFQQVDTAPAIKRTTKPKATSPTSEPKKAKVGRPAGVTKKTTAPKKNGAAAKAKAVAKKADTKVKKAAAKPKAAAK